MDKREARTLAESLITKHGLIGWSFKFDRAKRRAGLTTYRTRTISMSESYVESNDLPEVTDTILHEVAHALVGHAAGHGAVWQRKAAAIGCSAERCTTAKITDEKGRYQARCEPTNGTPHVVTHYFRRPSARMVQGGFCRKHKNLITWLDTETGQFLTAGLRRPAPVAARAARTVAPPVLKPWQASSDWDSMFNA